MDITDVIRKIVKAMDSGKTVRDISNRYGIDEDFVTEVLQIYTTHRGIDIQGIIDRLPEDMI